MEIRAQYDIDSSTISQQLIFSCDRFEIHPEDIDELKKRKRIKLFKGDDLPSTIPCQVLIQCETFAKAKVTIFNPSFEFAPEVLDEVFLNKDLIEQSRRNGGGFRLEFTIPLKDPAIKLNLTYEI
jgi:hypothetical protein